MALEAVILQQDPFIYGRKEYMHNMGGVYGEEEKSNQDIHINEEDASKLMNNSYLDTISSPESCGLLAVCQRKRRRSKPKKNKEEMENQRMTHIAVERNRRRQMNHYLAALRSLMPPSYSQRGDQTSIVGGAINFVKQLEQLHQFLEANKPDKPNETPFSNFFTFPQYKTCPSNTMSSPSSIAEIEVTMMESHANIKLSTKRRPQQLLKLVAGFQSMGLTIRHLNITTVDHSVLYSFSVKVEDDCELCTVNDIATSVHDMLGMIQEESNCCQDKLPGDI